MAFKANKALLAISALLFGFGAQAQTTAGSNAAIIMAQASTQSAPAVSNQQLNQLLAGGKLEEALQLAKQLGLNLKDFAVLAAQQGVSVAAITTAVLNSGVSAEVGLKALGDAFAGNQEALAAVFSTAITMASITLDPSAVESSIEAGCGKDCLPAALVASLTQSASASSAPATTGSTTTNSTSSGSGSGTAKPVSPAG